MNQHRIPATVVTGFLGSGKTTLVRNLIARAKGRRIAIIVNEFGDMDFDGGLLRDCGDPSCSPDTVVELANGCICCTVADEFLPTMEVLLSRNPPPDHIVVETSGLALPQPLVRAFGWPSVRHRVTVDGVVTVVDAPAVADGRMAAQNPQADDPRRGHDDPIEELFEDQLRCADLIVVSKSDLVDETTLQAVEAVVAGGIRPGTRRLRSDPSGLPPSVLIGLAAEAEAHMSGRESHHDDDEPHDHDDFGSFILSPEPFSTLDALTARVKAALAVPGVLRIKGRASLTGKASPVVVQGVGSRVETYFDPQGGATGLVVIGVTGLPSDRVSAALSA